MKKILILVGLFLIALIAGFLFAERNGIIPHDSPDQSTQSQVRYLILHVDDLSRPKPTLQTVWGAFVSFGDLTAVYFNPIYPLQNNRADLAGLFTLTEERLLSEPFLKAVEKYELDLTGYLIVDDAGEQVLLKWLLPDAPPQSGSLLTQRATFTQICQNLNKNKYAAFPQFDWKRLFPDHLIPSPRIESTMILFDRLFYRSPRVQCQVPE